jgi:hypothetical protein
MRKSARTGKWYFSMARAGKVRQRHSTGRVKGEWGASCSDTLRFRVKTDANLRSRGQSRSLGNYYITVVPERLF